MGCSIEHTLSKFACDTKLHAAADQLEGRDGIQKDLGHAWKVGPWEPHKVQQGQLHLWIAPAPGLGQFKAKIQAGQEWIETSPEEEDFQVFANEELDMTL